MIFLIHVMIFLSLMVPLIHHSGLRGQDVASVVQSPRRVARVTNIITKLETGDLKLRVRVLESEAAFARIEAVQGSLTSAVMATLMLNAGAVLAGSTSGPAVFGSKAMFAFAGFFSLKVPIGYFKVSCFRCCR